MPTLVPSGSVVGGPNGPGVDGSEIRHSPVDIVHIPLLAGFHTCVGWMCVSDMFLFVTIPVITGAYV